MSQELFERAIQLEEEGRLEEAFGVWQEICETSPAENGFLRLGSCAQDLGRLKEASSAFSQALAINQNSFPALLALGNLAAKVGDYRLAEDCLRRAVALQEQPYIFSLLGVALRHLGLDIEAEAAYRKAISLDASYEEAYFNLGVVIQKNQPAEARAMFRKALELDPTFAVAHRELGFALFTIDKTEAGFHLEKAVEIEPKDAWAHVYLGTYYWEMGEAALAAAEFQIAHQFQPHWAFPLTSLGNLHEMALKDHASARWFFERALELEPNDSVALAGFGRYWKNRGDLKLAKEYLERALLDDSEYQQALRMLGEISDESA